MLEDQDPQRISSIAQNLRFFVSHDGLCQQCNHESMLITSALDFVYAIGQSCTATYGDAALLHLVFPLCQRSLASYHVQQLHIITVDGCV